MSMYVQDYVYRIVSDCSKPDMSLWRSTYRDTIEDALEVQQKWEYEMGVPTWIELVHDE